VPAVVASPYSKPIALTDVVYDHSSVLATIEFKWNLPALTDRDANAAP
jgi:phospholipase C